MTLPDMPDTSLIELHDVTIGYTRKKKSLPVQTGLNLHVHAGELVCLIGPNGCGKSTLIRSIAGLQPLLAGDIRIGGRKTREMHLSEKARLVSFVLTDRIEVENLTVYELVAMGRNPYTSWTGRLSDEDRQAVGSAIRQVHMEGYEERPVSSLSDGERQRTLIAKALSQETPVILLDEPTSHLDLPNRAETLLLLRQLVSATGKAVLLSTHELDLALQTSDKIWLMAPGNGGISVGTPDELLRSNRIQTIFATPLFTFVNDGESVRIKFNANR